MSNKKSIMITCKEATHLISIRDEEKLSLHNRFKLMLHLKLCSVCLYFAKHVEILKSSLKNIVEDKNISFTEDKKKALEKIIEENLNSM